MRNPKRKKGLRLQVKTDDEIKKIKLDGEDERLADAITRLGNALAQDRKEEVPRLDHERIEMELAIGNRILRAREERRAIAAELRTLLVKLAPKADAAAIETACERLLKAIDDYRRTFPVLDGDIRRTGNASDSGIQDLGNKPTMKLKPGLRDARESLRKLKKKLQRALDSENTLSPVKLKKLVESLHLSIGALSAFRKHYGLLGKLKRELLTTTDIESTLRAAIDGATKAHASLKAKKVEEAKEALTPDIHCAADIHRAALARDVYGVLLDTLHLKPAMDRDDDPKLKTETSANYARLLRKVIQSCGGERKGDDEYKVDLLPLMAKGRDLYLYAPPGWSEHDRDLALSEFSNPFKKRGVKRTTSC